MKNNTRLTLFLGAAGLFCGATLGVAHAQVRVYGQEEGGGAYQGGLRQGREAPPQATPRTSPAQQARPQGREAPARGRSGYVPPSELQLPKSRFNSAEEAGFALPEANADMTGTQNMTRDSLIELQKQAILEERGPLPDHRLGKIEVFMALEDFTAPMVQRIKTLYDTEGLWMTVRTEDAHPVTFFRLLRGAWRDMPEDLTLKVDGGNRHAKRAGLKKYGVAFYTPPLQQPELYDLETQFPALQERLRAVRSDLTRRGAWQKTPTPRAVPAP